MVHATITWLVIITVGVCVCVCVCNEGKLFFRTFLPSHAKQQIFAGGNRPSSHPAAMATSELCHIPVGLVCLCVYMCLCIGVYKKDGAAGKGRIHNV